MHSSSTSYIITIAAHLLSIIPSSIQQTTPATNKIHLNGHQKAPPRSSNNPHKPKTKTKQCASCSKSSFAAASATAPRVAAAAAAADAAAPPSPSASALPHPRRSRSLAASHGAKPRTIPTIVVMIDGRMEPEKGSRHVASNRTSWVVPTTPAGLRFRCSDAAA